MSAPTRPLFRIEHTFVRDLEGLYRPWSAAAAPAPRLVVLNDELAAELGVDADRLRTPEGVAVLVGNEVPEGATPVAQAYSGHQFGGFTPNLGDGRALLVGEVLDRDGRRRDLHLKGSGRTPFARGGDGKAPLGPMLREYVISEAMAALGIPTTRALAVVATGEDVVRDALVPGAVLVRVASSHLRVGTFQFAALRDANDPQQPSRVRRLADYAIARHHPSALDADHGYLAFLDAVVGAQASLVAQWMLVGFVHGVMNTDNMTISGETIDYGPCAFLDAFDPATVFSSIDHGGRYAYGNQPRIAAWNLARLAETLLPLLDADTDRAVAAATEVLASFSDRYTAAFTTGTRAKLGLSGRQESDTALIDDVLALLAAERVDPTSFYRDLAAAARGEDAPVRALVLDRARLDAWLARWRDRLDAGDRPAAEVADGMDRINPRYIPRNHRVEEALTAATAGDVEPFRRLVDVVRRPFEARPGLEAYEGPDPDGAVGFQTFCGT